MNKTLNSNSTKIVQTVSQIGVAVKNKLTIQNSWTGESQSIAKSEFEKISKPIGSSNSSPSICGIVPKRRTKLPVAQSSMKNSTETPFSIEPWEERKQNIAIAGNFFRTRI